MKKIHFMFLIGGLFLVIGIATFYSYGDLISKEFPDLAIVLEDVLLQPAERISSPLMLEEDEKFFYTVTTTSHSNLMFFSLTTSENLVLQEFTFNDFVSLPIIVNSSGVYTIKIGNMGSDNVNINGFITKKPVLDEKELLFNFSIAMIASSLLVTFGIILIIIGAIFFLINKKRSKTKVIKKK